MNAVENGTPEAPKNFDQEAFEMRSHLKAKGIVMVVVEAEGRGTGISAHVAPESMDKVPALLRKIASKLERDIAFAKAKGRG